VIIPFLQKEITGHYKRMHGRIVGEMERWMERWRESPSNQSWTDGRHEWAHMPGNHRVEQQSRRAGDHCIPFSHFQTRCLDRRHCSHHPQTTSVLLQLVCQSRWKSSACACRCQRAPGKRCHNWNMHTREGNGTRHLFGRTGVPILIHRTLALSLHAEHTDF
jgi:hypothetical protein